MKHIITLVITVFCFALTSGGAMASDPVLIGTYGDWSAYSYTENGKKVCYMASQPKKAQGDYTKRGEVFALVTHSPGAKTKNVFSYMAGYKYKNNSEVIVTVKGQTFKLFTQGEGAWTPDAKTDNALAQAIRTGSTMVVKGTSSRGTLTTDTYGLSGSGAAHDAIGQACGI